MVVRLMNGWEVSFASIHNGSLKSKSMESPTLFLLTTLSFETYSLGRHGLFLFCLFARVSETEKTKVGGERFELET